MGGGIAVERPYQVLSAKAENTHKRLIRQIVVSSCVMAGARGLWRVEIPGGAGESPYRVGGLLQDVTQPGAGELTASWVKENLKHLKLDRVVEMAKRLDYATCRLIAASGDRSVPLP